MIFGKRCIFCERTVKKADCEFHYRFVGVCRDCMNEIEREKIVRILDVRKPLAMLIPCTHYMPKVRHALHQYKFENDRAYAKVLAYIAKRKLAKWKELSRFDAVVTLPVSESRMRERGYNQSLFMGEAISEQFGVPEHNEYIKRIKNTKKQSELKSVDRVINISGAYEASPEVRDKNIIVVDDIYTTGATMTEAARAFKNAEADVIVGVAFTAVKLKKRNENIVW